MNVSHLLYYLNRMQVELSLIDEQLKISYPEGKLTAELIATIKENKVSIIKFLRKRQKKNIFFPIRPEEKKEWYPLSSAQRRLYILQELDIDGIAYNIPKAFAIKGEVAEERIKKTLERMIVRHEGLRTSFPLLSDQPVQRIQDKVDFKIEYGNLRKEFFGQSKQECIEEIIKTFIRPFSLNTAPLLRIKFLRVEENDCIVFFDIHHIISDAVTLNIVVKDFLALYDEKGVAEQKIQYKDYLEWWRSEPQLEIMEEQEKFWMTKLSGEITALDLPYDFPRPVVQSFEGNSKSIEIEPEKVAELKKIIRIHNVTMYMLILAIINILLSKLANQEDIIVGTPIAGRKHPDVANVIGIFINTLVMRNSPVGAKTFLEFLHEVRDNAIDAFNNQDYQYEILLEKLNLNRDTSRNPLFDVLFVYQSVDMTELKIDGLEVKPYAYVSTISKIDLSFGATDYGEIFMLGLEYCSKLFKGGTVERFIAYFNEIMSLVSANPGIRIDEIEVMPGEEKLKILYKFNETKTEYPRNKSIHELFFEQSIKKPDRTALVFADKQISYNVLNERSERLAEVLRRRGIGRGSIVGIMMQRSAEMIIGIFGVLKAGGTYLPIDPDYPGERVVYMMEESVVSVVLTGTGADKKVGAFESFNIEKIAETETGSTRLLSFSNLHSTNLPPAPAYIIYTSGSTGKPRGVMISHNAVINFITGMNDIINFEQRDIILCLTTISFDIFGLEVLLPLTGGLKVIIGSEKEQVEVEAALSVLEREKITIFQCTPSRLQLFLSAGLPVESFEKLRYLLIGGELLPQSLLEEVRRRTRGKIYNLYGPTETTIWSTAKDVTGKKALNIGKPIANTRVYILSRSGYLQVVGVAGELCIGGEGVSPGYCNNQELTNQKFAANPYIPGDVIYRTGDLARRLPDGNIEILGRLGQQVKLRGFRIELGEIETLLLQHEHIKEAVVVVKNDDSRGSYLCAYLVLKKEIGTPDLRKYLLKKIPVYMVPSHFVILERLPLTPNLKIDRNALPIPDMDMLRKGTAYTPPRNETEKKLVEIWRQILQKEQIGIRDEFFSLGGNSIFMLTLISFVKREFGVELSMPILFNHSTLEEIAATIEKKSGFQSPKVTAEKPAGLSSKDTKLNKRTEKELKKEIIKTNKYVSLESRSFLTLIATGVIDPVDAAVLNYLPMDILQYTSFNRDEIVTGILHDLPLVWQITETKIGRLAHIMLPFFTFEISRDSEEVINITLEAIRAAAAIGARVIGLTGHMQKPEFIEKLEEKMKDMRNKPSLTLGMDTNIACILLSYQGILEASGRDILRERLALIGVNSVTILLLKLAMLFCQHPKEILLVYEKGMEEDPGKTIRKLRRFISYNGPMRLIPLEDTYTVPDEVYDFTFIIGSIENSIEIKKVRPGSLLINLCFPFVAFNREEAWERIRENQDILVQNGVVKMKNPEPAQTLFYAMNEWEEFYSLIYKVVHQLNVPGHMDPLAPLTSCEMSSLLSAAYKKCRPTTRAPYYKNSRDNFRILKKMGCYNSTHLLCGNKTIAEECVLAFRAKYSH